jgi:hypothetical protein
MSIISPPFIVSDIDIDDEDPFREWDDEEEEE